MKVLTINLCGTWVHPRKERMRAVADFILREGVDVLLFQEGIAGLLGWHGLKYLQSLLPKDQLVRGPAFGFWGFFTFNVGILTRLPILATASAPLNVEVEEFLDRLPMPGRSRVIMARTEKMDIYSVHLSSSPRNNEEGRRNQVEMLLDFIAARSCSRPVVAGGDFNFIQNHYFKSLLQSHDFTGPAAGVDMILTRGCQVQGSQEVFMDHFVSDHVGLIAEVV